LYIKFTSDSKVVNLQGFTAAYYVTRKDVNAISASQVHRRADSSALAFTHQRAGGLSATGNVLNPPFELRRYIFRAPSHTWGRDLQDCSASTTVTDRSGTLRDGSAFK
jgi:hypothetical protein